MIASEELRQIHPGLELRYGWRSRRGHHANSFAQDRGRQNSDLSISFLKIREE